MLLLLDIGNTQTVIGLYKETSMTNHWRIHTDHQKSADEYGVLIRQLLHAGNIDAAQIKNVAIAGVVPPVLAVLTDMVERTFHVQPFVLIPEKVNDLTIKYEHPRDVGADRIANALAVKHKYPLPAIVVDFGTATTFDCISERGEYLGGVIVPGVEISLAALFNKAAKLPRVSLERPNVIIGTNTTMSIQAGIMIGTTGQIDAIVRAIEEEMQGRPTVVATGGLASLIGKHCQSVDTIDEFLTLEGLRLFFESAGK